ncbi:MAG: hypothetical protein ACJ71N_04815 [Terriglobales bacterium]|jgi:hypothetical protein
MKRLSILLVLCGTLAAQEVTNVDSTTPQDVQIRIAKTAGPTDVAENANVYILGKNGYELAVKGTNGFSCAIERQMPNTMEPECYDREGSRTTFLVRSFVEHQRAKGVSEEKIEQQIEAGYKSGKFKAPSKPGIVYMLSDSNYVFDPDSKKIIHFPGHLMFYAPYATKQTVSSGAGAPYIVNPGKPDALMIVVPAKH